MRKSLLNALPDFLLFGGITVSVLLHTYAPIAIISTSPIRLAGWGLAALGIFFAVSIVRSMRTHEASSDVIRTSKVLLDTGLFAVSRNPLYVCHVFTTLCVAIALGSVSAFIVPLLCFVLLHTIVIPYEEQQLRSTFGASYDSYAKRTRRWL